jgi:hypothetical protein
MTDDRSRRRWARLSAVFVLLTGSVLAARLTGLLAFELDPFASNSSRQRSAVRSASGDLRRLVGNFVVGLSRRRAYEEPGAGEPGRLAATFRAIGAGRLERAATLGGPLGYVVVRYVDTVTGRKLVLLVERGGRPRGWGLYVHSRGSHSKLVVEVAHPASDIHSERVGVEAFRHSDAAELFVAGARRDAASDGSSDVAHNRQTVFEAVHRTAVRPGAILLQPHGFDESKRSDQYGEIVVSSGGPPTKLVMSLADGLRTRGFEACVYRRDRCEGLGGTRNVQGHSARAAGACFVHLELARRLRESRPLRGRVASAIAEKLGRASPRQRCSAR